MHVWEIFTISISLIFSQRVSFGKGIVKVHPNMIWKTISMILRKFLEVYSLRGARSNYICKRLACHLYRIRLDCNTNKTVPNLYTIGGTAHMMQKGLTNYLCFSRTTMFSNGIFKIFKYKNNKNNNKSERVSIKSVNKKT